MKKYLLWLLAVPIMSPLLSLASAADYTFTSSSADDWLYNPNSLTLSSDSVIDSISYTEHDSEYGAVCICHTDDDCTYDFDWINDNLLCSFDTDSNDNSCENKSLSAWTYFVGPCTDKSFASLTLNISSSSSWGSDSVFPELSVPSSFTSWMTQLVENFGWTISNWLPVVILVALWITAIFALFRVVRWYAKSAFKW